MEDAVLFHDILVIKDIGIPYLRREPFSELIQRGMRPVAAGFHFYGRDFLPFSYKKDTGITKKQVQISWIDTKKQLGMLEFGTKKQIYNLRRYPCNSSIFPESVTDFSNPCSIISY